MYTLYSKPACPFCDQAKTLLASKDLEFKTVHVNVGQPQMQGEVYIEREQFAMMFPGQRTLPLIFEGEVRIGGFTELKKHLEAV